MILRTELNPRIVIREEQNKVSTDKHLSPETEFEVGRVAWNKGLTKETDERVRKGSEGQKKAWENPEVRRKHLTIIPLEEPQICYFCGELITMQGNRKDCLLTHSKDLNHDNWAPENKVPVHRGCHITFHKTGTHHTKNAKEKMCKSHTGKRLTEEHKRNIGKAVTGEKNGMFGKTGKNNPRFGKHPTEETRRKMRDWNRKYWGNLTPEELKEHGRKSSEGRKRVN